MKKTAKAVTKKKLVKTKGSMALTRRGAAAVVKSEAGPENPMAMFERLAKDPKCDPEKLERLIAMQKDIMAVNAKAAFDAAFVTLASEIPEMDKRGKIVVPAKGDRTGHSTPYAKHEDIQRVLRPLLLAHGFALSYESAWPDDGKVQITAILTHREGHSRKSVFVGPADTTGSKNGMQALGSTIAYGRRYATADLLNITTRKMDDDGKTGGAEPADAKKKETAHNANDTRQIVKAQAERLTRAFEKSGRTKTEIQMWLKVRYNINSSTQIWRGIYDEVVAAIEAPGPLPQDEREPGGEG